jgi:uncharacterized membrane protein YeaQ/YmgE (transglycosylase-associated protein family)
LLDELYGRFDMVGAIIVGFFAGVIGRMLMPGDPFRHLSGPKSWGVSVLVGLAGALLGYLIFTVGLGIGDTDIFDWGGIVGAIIGVFIVLIVAGWVLRSRQRKAQARPPTPPTQATPPAS